MNETTAPPSAAEGSHDRPTKLITRLHFREKLGGISDDKFYALIRDGVIKPPIKIGVASRWLESDADNFIQKLAEARQAPSTPAGIRRHHAELAEKRKRRVMALSEKANRTEAEVT